MLKKLLLIISTGITLQWISLFLSYRELPEAKQKFPDIMATGGFPFKIFTYPFPPTGNDHAPIEAWPMFFLNLGIWVVIVVIIYFVLKEKLTEKTLTRFCILFCFLAIFLSAIGKLYLLLKFD